MWCPRSHVACVPLEKAIEYTYVALAEAAEYIHVAFYAW